MYAKMDDDGTTTIRDQENLISRIITRPPKPRVGGNLHAEQAGQFSRGLGIELLRVRRQFDLLFAAQAIGS